MPQRRFLENVTQLNCSNSALLQRLTNIEELEENLAKEKLKDPDYKASLVKKMAQEKLSTLPNKNDKGSRSHLENKIRKFFLNYEFKSWFLTDCAASGLDKNNAQLMLKEIDGGDGKDANEESKAARKKAREKMSLESWFIAHHPSPITRVEAKELLKNEQTRSAAKKGMSKERNDDREKKNDLLGFTENETLNAYESFLKYVFHRDKVGMSKDKVLEYIRTDSQFVNPDPRWTAEMKLEHLQQSNLQLSELNNSSIDFLCKIGVDFQLLRKTAITVTCEQSAAATSIPLPLEIKTELYCNEETKELIAFHLRGDEQINEDSLKGLTRYDDIEGIGLSTGRVSPLTLEHVAKNHPELMIKHKFSNTLREPFKVTDREGNLIQSPFPDYLFTNLGSGFLRMCVKGSAIEQIKSEIGNERAEFADFAAVINQEERDLYRLKNVGYVADNAASFGRFLQSNFQWLSENSFVRGSNNSNRPVQDNVFPSITVFSKSIADTTNLGGNDFHNDYLTEQMKRELNALNDCDIICTGHVTSVLIKEMIFRLEMLKTSQVTTSSLCLIKASFEDYRIILSTRLQFNLAADQSPYSQNLVSL